MSLKERKGKLVLLEIEVNSLEEYHLCIIAVLGALHRIRYIFLQFIFLMIPCTTRQTVSKLSVFENPAAQWQISTDLFRFFSLRVRQDNNSM
jgi:hypothetical protein